MENDGLAPRGTVSESGTVRALVSRADVRPDDEVAKSDAAMLVDAKAVCGVDPLYGRVVLNDLVAGIDGLEGALQTRAGIYGAVAEQGLFDRLALAPGAILHMGEISLRLNGVIAKEPDRNAGGFPLAPRLMVSHDTLKAAGLLRPGALINDH